MIFIEKSVYAELTARLRDALSDENDIFNGTVSWEQGALEFAFTATLVLYRAESRDAEGVGRHLVDAVPVWWEFLRKRGGERFRLAGTEKNAVAITYCHY